MPDAGTITFKGRDITRLPAHARVRLGIAYTFQITAIYPRLSVLDNVALAVQRRGHRDIAGEARAALARVGLDGHAGETAGTLAYGHQRLLEIAMGLALRPELLILDEPTQGLADGEIDAFKRARPRDRRAGHRAPDRAQHGRRDGPRRAHHRPRVRPHAGDRHPGRDPRRPGGAGRLPRAMILAVENLHAGYGATPVLRGLSLAVDAGEVLCLMGRNGAGKSTALKAIMGLVPATAGTIRLAGTRIDGLPAHEVPRRGVAWVPQGRRLFAELTVAENLEIGLMARRTGRATRERTLALFPRLRERLGQVSGTLSGGEQQMLAIARALCLRPKVLLLDEPTEGLQPSMTALIRDTIGTLRATGVATILVEQRVDTALAVADRIAFVTGGTVAETVPVAGLAPDAAAVPRLRRGLTDAIAAPPARPPARSPPARACSPEPPSRDA